MASELAHGGVDETEAGQSRHGKVERDRPFGRPERARATARPGEANPFQCDTDVPDLTKCREPLSHLLRVKEWAEVRPQMQHLVQTIELSRDLEQLHAALPIQGGCCARDRLEPFTAPTVRGNVSDQLDRLLVPTKLCQPP